MLYTFLKKKVTWCLFFITVKAAKHQWKKIRDCHRESLKRQADAPTNIWRYAGVLEFLLPYIKSRKKAGDLPNESHHMFHETATEGLCTVLLEDAHYDENQTIHSQSEDSNLTSEQSLEPRTKRRKVDDESLRDLLNEVVSECDRRCEERDKRRAEDIEDAKKNKHPLNLFFDSMCEITKNFPDTLQRDVKKKIFNVVCEAEEIYENYVSESTSTSSALVLPKEETDP